MSAHLQRLRSNWHLAARWMPAMDDAVRAEERENWERAVERTFGWIKPEARAANE